MSSWNPKVRIRCKSRSQFAKDGDEEIKWIDLPNLLETKFASHVFWLRAYNTKELFVPRLEVFWITNLNESMNSSLNYLPQFGIVK